ncbi:MAG TPA: DUF4389 domain-containing protein [Gemmatimonadaceae bacterium]|jgi:hypothetical protein
MDTMAMGHGYQATYPVQVHVEPAVGERNRLTTAFRFILAFPHLILVGGPVAATMSWTWGNVEGRDYGWGAAGGAFGAAVGAVTFIVWFAILFTGQHPRGLWDIAAFYLRWRVRAVSYIALLRDEYPPFGSGPYPATLDLTRPDTPRDRLSVAFRIILIIPHLLAIWALGIAWFFTTIVGWFAILFTGRFPESLYRFGVGVLRWNTRVEAYLLLLRDEYPPFSLD